MNIIDLKEIVDLISISENRMDTLLDLKHDLNYFWYFLRLYD